MSARIASEKRAARLAEMARNRKLRASGVRWESPCRRWTLSGGGPKSRGCTYTLRDCVSGETRTVRTMAEAKEWVAEQTGEQPARKVVVSGMPDTRRNHTAPLRGAKLQTAERERDLSDEEIERIYQAQLAGIRARRRA